MIRSLIFLSLFPGNVNPSSNFLQIMMSLFRAGLEVSVKTVKNASSSARISLSIHKRSWFILSIFLTSHWILSPHLSSDDDEPLQSGSGSVGKDCEESILLGWGELLAKWRVNLSVHPKQLKGYVRKSVPEALRGEIWQLLAGVHESENLLEDYRILITKVSNTIS